MPIYPYSFQLPPLNVQDIPNDGVPGEFLGISAGGQLDWLPAGGGGGSGDMLAANNLSELTNFATARTNIGLGTTSTPTFANLTLTSPSLASSAPVTISQTWDHLPTAFTAFKVNATSTNSASGSLLLDLQVGGTSVFKVSKTGSITANNTINLAGSIVQSSGNFIPSNALIFDYFNQDVVLQRDGAANTLALRNGAAAQTFNVYGTSSASNANYARLALTCGLDGNATISTQALGTGTAGVLAFSPSNTERMRITTAGNVGIGTTAPRTKLHLEDTSANSLLEISGTTTANFTGVGFLPNVGTNTTGRFGQGSLVNGGLSILGFTANTNVVPAIRFAGHMGSGSPTQPTLIFESWKHNGSTGRVALADTEISSQWLNGSTPLMTLLGGGNVGIGTTSPTSKLHVVGGNILADNYIQGQRVYSYLGTSTYAGMDTAGMFTNTGVIGFSANTGVNFTNSCDTFLVRDGEPYHLALRNGTNGQKFSVYGTYPGAAWERFTITAPTSGNVLLGTYRGTGGIARGLEFQTDGVTRMSIDAAGGTVFGVGVTLATNNNSISGFRFFGLGSNNLLIDNGSGGFNRLTLGGASSSYPALKRVGSEFQIVKADTTAADNVAAGDADLTFIEDRYRRKGAGTPEGVVTAPIGAVYHNTTGGAGTSFYVKESGTGNTGWVGK